MKNIGSRDNRPIETRIKSQSLPNSSRAQRPGPSATSTLLSKDHRYRPETLWYPPMLNERLGNKPNPFTETSLVPTTTTDDPKTARRVQKAWMYCISSGPCWELIENRAFYKEEYERYEPNSKSGREIRPLVYSERIQSTIFAPFM
jgi:transcription factor C subunit 6